MLLKVGELAKRAGLTVRTLHHYDSIGLLSLSARSASGFRLYGQEDVVRLHRIQASSNSAVRSLDIKTFLEEPGASIVEIISLVRDSMARGLPPGTATDCARAAAAGWCARGSDPGLDLRSLP